MRGRERDHVGAEMRRCAAASYGCQATGEATAAFCGHDWNKHLQPAQREHLKELFRQREVSQSHWEAYRAAVASYAVDVARRHAEQCQGKTARRAKRKVAA